MHEFENPLLLPISEPTLKIVIIDAIEKFRKQEPNQKLESIFLAFLKTRLSFWGESELLDVVPFYVSLLKLFVGEELGFDEEKVIELLSTSASILTLAFFQVSTAWTSHENTEFQVQKTLEAVCNQIKFLVVKHSIERPPYSISIYNLPQLIKFEKWITSILLPALPSIVQTATKLNVEIGESTSKFFLCQSCGANRLQFLPNADVPSLRCDICFWTVIKKQ